ncbi:MULTISPECIES: hypothetical protein [Burkholderia]|uniref:hypothetical protein n=1 Tax=Burkholderia TaxID=32008 RepID=UPI000755ACDC|nr:MULTISPECIES: hypothetical protein [Burkholderia]KWH51740.1 hypothetical protein WT63_31990 [Burkholderia anthina]
MLIPVEADVDSEVTVLLVELRLVDNEVTPLCAVLIPVEVDVDSEVTELLVELSPVESDAIELLADTAPAAAVDRLVTLDATAVIAWFVA